MRRYWWFTLLALAAGCQAPAARSGAHAAAGEGDDALARLAGTLAGEYDNHEQVQRAAAAASNGAALAVPHVHVEWRLVSSDRGASGLWLARLKTLDASANADAVWLYLISSADGGRRVVLTPYRGLDPAAAAAAFNERTSEFKFVAAQWAELAPCAQSGEWKNGQFSATANAAACSALLPGLGASAALLPLRIGFDGDMLRIATFADQARGGAAESEARRVVWFNGWSAISGGGRSARADNQDWHTQQNLRLSSEGGRIPIRWRDGAPSGYSLELERRTYTERKLSVLELSVVEDASGRVLDYAWTSPQATAIGLNLGWLQVGFTIAPAAAD